MSTRRSIMLLGPVLGLMLPAAHAGPEWEEPASDSGNLPATAKAVTGPIASSVQTITGMLGADSLTSGIDAQDMFLIEIDSPTAFSATLDASATAFDTQLWLFDASGLGLLGNDDLNAVSFLSALGPAANDGTGVVIPAAGLYYLAISGADSDPTSLPGAIFAQASATEISGPDGPGGSMPITGWTATGATGAYAIDLTGVRFILCPADLNADALVGFDDLVILLSAWGPCAGCAADLDTSGAVGFDDLVRLLSVWGPCL